MVSPSLASALRAAENEIAQGASPPDDPATTHVRCGSDLQETLTQAGFQGEFVSFSDPYCLGPVPRTDLRSVRAQFLGTFHEGDPTKARAKLEQEHARLKAAANRERIVLWFEHDPYDQLILARVLTLLTEWQSAASCELICIDRFETEARFTGLGQLSPAALRVLWNQRKPVTPELQALGQSVWQALTEPSPMPLFRLARSNTPALPLMAPALIRHLQELPWVTDGLSYTQRIALTLLKDGPKTATQVFRKLTHEVEPLPHLGDLMFWSVLDDLAHAPTAPLAIDVATADRPWPERQLSLTDTGLAIVDGRQDWMALSPPKRWVGGVPLDAKSPFRWDDQISAVIEGRAASGTAGEE